jgi:hypothetical protein
MNGEEILITAHACKLITITYLIMFIFFGYSLLLFWLCKTGVVYSIIFLLAGRMGLFQTAERTAMWKKKIRSS